MSSAYEDSGLAGGHMVEVGHLTRGMRGQYAYEFRPQSPIPAWFYRDSLDEQPSLRLFVLIPKELRAEFGEKVDE